MMGANEISRYINYLAIKRNVSASTQNLALCSIIFLYKQVLNKEINEIDLIRAKKPRKLPVVFTRKEVKAVIMQLTGINLIMANLLYGCGLRLMECVRLRVKDIEFEYNQVIVRDGKGKERQDNYFPFNYKRKIKATFTKSRKTS